MMSDVTTTAKKPSMDSAKLDERYVRRLSPDPSGGYTATIHEFPGCIAEGDSAEEALSNLESAALSWMRSAHANGYPVSPPLDYEGASGKIALRVSRRLHQLAAERADLEGISLNQFIGNALASYLGQQDGMRRLAYELHKAVQSNLYFFYQNNFSAVHGRSTNDLRVIPTMKFREVSSSASNLMITAAPEPKMFMEISHG
ncbi:toxin-antitoxin system HicB family antitoxin [Comamonas thiooxydans]|uniref:type II toxin-antitoxin system HicB family antitoxin n=1 Tax=Comamonas TaxID=283 RepID=UPI00135F1646|nr:MULTISPECIES: type II toxin-antitoxin system HicB family antitoxin [Comamonas]BDR08215.1 toxin-antitoxin system HicB family antitoxin [Comamonas thiooxydans]